MSCFNHQDRNAVNDCEKCGKPICAECSVNVHGEIMCKECVKGAAKMNQNSFNRDFAHREPKTFYKLSKRYSSFITFLCSLLPGAGFMYLGLMKHGILVLCSFFLTLYVNTILDGSVFFSLLMCFIVTTSFFYTFKLKNKLNNGEYVEDNIDHIIDSLKKYAAIPVVVFILEIIKNIFRTILWNTRLGDYLGRFGGGRIVDLINLLVIVFVIGVLYKIYSRDRVNKTIDTRDNNDFNDKR